MPELPEVEVVRRGLAPVMEGARLRRVVARRPDLRWPLPENFAGRLAGRRIVRLGRRAKYLLADLDDGHALIMHLGMSGRFRIVPPMPGPAPRSGPGPATEYASAPGGVDPALEPGAFYLNGPRDPVHDHVVFLFDGGTRVVYNDARRFGFMDLTGPGGAAGDPRLARLGLEPTAEALTPAALAGVLAGRATSLKAALLDQRRIAGLGNIYVCEALHRAGLSPARAAGSLAPNGRPGARARRLAAAIPAVLAEAIAAGGSTLRDHQGPDGAAGRFQQRFRVYDRTGEPCPRPGCSGRVARIVQSGRSTFYCPVCQR